MQLGVLIVYSAMLVGIGLFISKRVKGASDFLVAGRSLGPGLLSATFLAANIGAGSTVGATGIGYTSGLSAWWWVGSAGIGSLILANTVGPKIWEIANRYDLRTVGDYLELRYHRNVRLVVAVLLWFGTLAILAGQLIAVSWILGVVADVPKWEGCFIGGLVVTAYFAAGGLLTSAWVNLVQLIVKFAGFLVAVPLVLKAVGGWHGAGVSAIAASHPLGANYFSLTGIGLRGILSYAVILIPSFVISPGLIQKLYGARNARVVRIGVNVNALGLLAFAFVPAILGIVARSQFQLTNPELALPTVMARLLPPWLGLLALAAVFSAEISACDAILFMLSSSLSVDLYKRVLRPQADEQDVLRVGRISAIGGAVLGILIAIQLPSIVSALRLFYGLMSVALTAPLLAGLYLWVGAQRALTAIVVSLAATISIYLATHGVGVGIFDPYALGIACSAVIILVPVLRKA